MSQVKLDDSNIANYGGADHERAKESKAQAETEFKGAGQAEGLEIWRIENFGVKRWPKNQYGTFFSGDCYLVLNTYKPDPKSAKLAFNAHFWLGAESTQDERGTAAFKVVELDDLLGDMPVQFREVQGYESEEFLTCFNGVVTLLKGGIDSAFNKVEPTKYVPRLLQFKGKKNVRVVDVPVETKSLNQGDVFVLDMGLSVIQWNGSESSAWEKRKAASIVAGIKSERGNATNTVIDGLEDHEIFWTTLGGKEGIQAAIPDVDVKKVAPVLHRVSDATGEVVVTEIASGMTNMKKSLLDTQDVFILDVGHRVFVWVGTGATAQEHKSGLSVATTFLANSGRPEHIPITKLNEGGEITAFNHYFGASGPSKVVIQKKAVVAATDGKSAGPFVGANGDCGVGCYLTYSEASNGSLFLNWKKAPVEDAWAYLEAGPAKKVPGFKFTKAGGKEELTRTCTQKANYFEGWSNFFKMAKDYKGSFVLNVADQVTINVIIGNKIHKLEVGQWYNLATVDAVCVTAHSNNPFEGVSIMDKGQFMNRGAPHGTARSF